jgi:hypothetical protein
MFVRLVRIAMKSLCGEDTPSETDKNRRQNPSKILQIIAIRGSFDILLEKRLSGVAK